MWCLPAEASLDKKKQILILRAAAMFMNEHSTHTTEHCLRNDSLQLLTNKERAKHFSIRTTPDYILSPFLLVALCNGSLITSAEKDQYFMSGGLTRPPHTLHISAPIPLRWANTGLIQLTAHQSGHPTL